MSFNFLEELEKTGTTEPLKSDSGRVARGFKKAFSDTGATQARPEVGAKGHQSDCTRHHILASHCRLRQFLFLRNRITQHIATAPNCFDVAVFHRGFA